MIDIVLFRRYFVDTCRQIVLRELSSKSIPHPAKSKLLSRNKSDNIAHLREAMLAKWLIVDLNSGPIAQRQFLQSIICVFCLR